MYVATPLICVAVLGSVGVSVRVGVKVRVGVWVIVAVRVGVLVGTGAEIRRQLEVLSIAGVEQVMLQWLDLDDLAGIEALSKSILN